MRHNRHRGGQPGNQNAKKHGFYSQMLTPSQRDKISAAISRPHDLDEDIALLRAKIRSVVANDPGNTRLLITAFSLLARLLRARQEALKPRDQRLADALRDVILELRSDSSPHSIHRQPSRATDSSTEELAHPESFAPSLPGIPFLFLLSLWERTQVRASGRGSGGEVLNPKGGKDGRELTAES